MYSKAWHLVIQFTLFLTLILPATAATCSLTSKPFTISFSECLPIIVSASTIAIISPVAYTRP